jgi:hypothetical protein
MAWQRVRETTRSMHVQVPGGEHGEAVVGQGGRGGDDYHARHVLLHEGRTGGSQGSARSKRHADGYRLDTRRGLVPMECRAWGGGGAAMWGGARALNDHFDHESPKPRPHLPRDGRPGSRGSTGFPSPVKIYVRSDKSRVASRRRRRGRRREQGTCRRASLAPPFSRQTLHFRVKHHVG